VTRYRWVAAREAEGFPTMRACEAAGVSRQSFYDWRQRVDAVPTPAEVAEVPWSTRYARSTVATTRWAHPG
jgi:hypothetical protein